MGDKGVEYGKKN